MKLSNINKRKTGLLSPDSAWVMVFFVYVSVYFSVDMRGGETMQIIDVDTNIFMRESRELQELLVRPGKEKYSSKNNPAVELMKAIRRNQSKSDPSREAHYSYDQYDKTTLGLLDIDEETIAKNDLKNYVDTTAFGQHRVLNVLLNERVSSMLYDGGSSDGKRVVRGKSSKGVSEMLDISSFEVILENFLQEVDIYDDDITLMGNKFPSPLSATGTLHYKYYLSDTLDVGGYRCIQLTFLPRTKSEYVFSGNLYVEYGDTTGFIRKVSMKVPREVNLNFVDDMYIEQEFEKDTRGNRHKTTDRVSLDLSVVKGTQRLYGSRTSKYDNFSYLKRTEFDRIYAKAGKIFDMEMLEGDGSLLARFRSQSLSEKEQNMDSFMSRMRENRFFYYTEKVLALLFNGYVKTGNPSKFDIGPLNTLLSMNPIEKVRFRVGGMTTAHLSPHWFGLGYVAYGIKDKKWKYQAEVEYSFNKKKYHSREFPLNSIRLSHKYDIDMIGQHYLFTNPDNIFISLKRESDKLATYCRRTKLEYNLELESQFSIGVWSEQKRQESTEWLPFISGTGDTYTHIDELTCGLNLRYAPGEKFIQEKSVRVPVNLDAPVFMLSQEWGALRFPGMRFTLCKTEVSIWKRFWFSTYGYLDALVKGGSVWSRVPFLYLLWQNANLSYTIQPESYSLMRPMEFALDRYASVDLTYWGNGVLFNRVPLLRKAKLREVVEFKGLWGNLTKKNNPACDSGLLVFPTDASVGQIGKAPYMEISAGIDNIFSILRLDYVWRLSYLDHPGTDRSGLRVALHFTF